MDHDDKIENDDDGNADSGRFCQKPILQFGKPFSNAKRCQRADTQTFIVYFLHRRIALSTKHTYVLVHNVKIINETKMLV